MLRRVVVHLEQRHEVTEVGVPADREMHPASQHRFIGVTDHRPHPARDPVEHPHHAAAAQQSATTQRPDVVHDMERPRQRVQGPGEHPGHRPRQPRESPDKATQHHDEQVPEQHVEQQLPVRAPRPVGPTRQIGPGRAIHEAAEVIRRGSELRADTIPVCRFSSHGYLTRSSRPHRAVVCRPPSVIPTGTRDPRTAADGLDAR